MNVIHECHSFHILNANLLGCNKDMHNQCSQMKECIINRNIRGASPLNGNGTLANGAQNGEENYKQLLN
jgi:hypothetical protein